MWNFLLVGCDSWGAIDKLDDENRRFLWEDIRASGCKAGQLSLINDISARYETDKDRPKTILSADKEEVEF